MTHAPILIIGADRKWEETALLSAAKHAGMRAAFLNAGDLRVVRRSATPAVQHKGKDISRQFRTSRIIFRRTRGARETMIALAEVSAEWKVLFTDSLRSIRDNLDKRLSVPPFSSTAIHPIPTLFIDPAENARCPKGWTFPLLIKPALGRHGEGIRIFKTEKVLRSFLRTNRSPVLLQPLLTIDKEFRVFCVGDRALGTIRKIPKKGSLVANYAAGAKFVKAVLPARVAKEAVKICASLEIDIGGVDLARVGKQYYLLEVNRCPEFSAFTKATEMDVASAIVRFVLKKK